MKYAAVSTIVVLLAVASVIALVWGLLSMWEGGSTPVTYVIVDIIDNTGIELPNCDSPRITIIQNVDTNQISYKCDIHGKISEIVTLYE